MLKELIKKKEQLKQLQAEIKELEERLIQEGLEEERVDDYVVKKVIRISYKLKPEVDEQKIVEEYPEATQIKVDVKELVKMWAADLLEEKETEYLQVKRINNDKHN